MAIRKNIFLCLCGPSGCGKTTISLNLKGVDANLLLSISTTTRALRGAEQNGVDYFFVDREEFQSRVKLGKFIEHAEFNGQLYGTEVHNISLAESENKDLLLDIDYQGALQMKRNYPEQTVVVFIFPPSFAILENRIRSRKTEEEPKIISRLKSAREEIVKLKDPLLSDYFVMNDTLEQAVQQLLEIVHTERLRLSRISRDYLNSILE